MLKSYTFEPREGQNYQPYQLEAAPGFKFITVKFLALLTCIIAWLAGERWRLDALADNSKDFYAILAAKVSEAYTVNSDVNLRDIVEKVDLGLCFDDLSLIDLIEQGIERDKTYNFKYAWEKANPEIAAFIEGFTASATGDPLYSFWKHPKLNLFGKDDSVLCIQLPSGRSLLFCQTESDYDELNHPYLLYYRFSLEDRSYRLSDGGDLLKIVANAIAIDLLNSFMLNILTKTNYRIVSSLQDRFVLEVPDYESADTVKKLTTDLPTWAETLPLRVEVSECTLTPDNDQQDHPEQ